MDQKFEKWKRWLADEIHWEIEELVTNKHIFWEIQKMIDDNPNIQEPCSFNWFIGQIYSDYGVIAVRRQIKSDRQSISFVRLLKEMIMDPGVLSRERFVNMYRIGMKNIEESKTEYIGNKTFDRHFSGGCTNYNHIDPIMVQQDLDELKKHSCKLEDFADKRVAHYDKKAPKTIPTFNDLDACIDWLEKLTIKYTLLFEGKDLGENLVIEFLEDYWEEIFSQPWIVDTARQTYNSLDRDL
ncbi:hypothetical protein J4G08_01560 [Candidatus Poribacteria bacterium]|nr:hypothetical protein [Candidatus Poribacteria bacterium]